MRGMIRFAAVIILSTLAFSQSATDPFTIRVGVDLVNVLFSVTDRNGRFISDLGREDFVVKEDGEIQQVQYFNRENELPLTLALLVDTSPSVRVVFDEQKRTAAEFLHSILRPQDLALLIGFDRSVTLMQDFTESGGLLARAIGDLEIGSGTSLYDAVYLASDDRLRHEAGRKAIILISDGEDTTSRINRTEALIAAHQADAVIYAISNALPQRGFFGGGPNPGNRRTLEELARETGGALYMVNNRTPFEEIFAQIADELRSQYSLGYVSTNVDRSSEYREIEITPTNRDYRVRARRGYYASPPNDAETR